MNRKRRSVIWAMPKKELERLVATSVSYSELLSYFKLQNKGANYKTLHKRLEEDGINTDAIDRNRTKFRKKQQYFHKLEDVLKKGIKYNGQRLLSRLIAAGIKEKVCEHCGNKGRWKNQTLTLVLDHIDGDHENNTLSNLRILCPNCHSQTETFAGSKRKITSQLHTSIKGLPKLKERRCPRCRKAWISNGAEHCKNCSDFLRRKIEIRPTRTRLLKDVKQLGFLGTGKKYKVSDNAIRKWLDLR